MHVAFEFATGAGAPRRIAWHAKQLATLARSVNRPLHLVVRAAKGDILAGLVSAFAHTTVLDTMSFIKTVHRQRAVKVGMGRVEWRRHPTAPNTPLDEMLQHNWSVMKNSYDAAFFRTEPSLDVAV